MKVSIVRSDTLRRAQECDPADPIYTPGLDSIHEPIISSHFMHELANDILLQPYSDEQFSEKLLRISSDDLCNKLIPIMRKACKTFCNERANAARERAIDNYQKFDLSASSEIAVEHFIAETMFDRQYLRGPRENCSRKHLAEQVRIQIDAGSPIQMVIPALPLKISSPLKSRGPFPDLGEVNFLLGLFEVARTIELLYQEVHPQRKGKGCLASFTVLSDGYRFHNAINEPENEIETYKNGLERWIALLGLTGYVHIADYRAILAERLPAATLQLKSKIRERARRDYADALESVFDPYDMANAMTAAVLVEPDPEYANPEGRFIALLKSLVYTMNYQALATFNCLSSSDFGRLYRELTSHIFSAFARLSVSDLSKVGEKLAHTIALPLTIHQKEYLRQAMLREAWSASIDYIAEIKSDRELAEDPVVTCFPGYFRWTIHPKAGQLALLAPTAFGAQVQPWAGTGVFKLTKRNKIKLCSLPVLALEGTGAIPVQLRDVDQTIDSSQQPLFYIYNDVEATSIKDLLSQLPGALIRKRTN